jgi:hypothetical protein
MTSRIKNERKRTTSKNDRERKKFVCCDILTSNITWYFLLSSFNYLCGCHPICVDETCRAE